MKVPRVITAVPRAFVLSVFFDKTGRWCAAGHGSRAGTRERRAT